MWQFIRIFWGTFEKLAAQGEVRWPIFLAGVALLQGCGNIALHEAFGLDWLGTRPLLCDTTFVGGFDYLQIDLADWVAVFAALLPVLALYELVIVPGVAQLMSRLRGGQGSFEQMVLVLTFAIGVPALSIGATSE